MLKLTIISLMAGSPWGGSEELWCDVANNAIDRGYKVQISVPDWSFLPPRLEVLEDKGAQISRRSFWRPGETISEKVIRKTSRAFLRKKRNSFYDVGRFAPDIILISQGGSFDFSNEIELHRMLNTTKIPFALLCHSLSGNHFLDDERRKCSIEWFSRAKFIGFVANRTLVMAEHKLASKLGNTKIVRNPVNLTDLSMVPQPEVSNTMRMACIGEMKAEWKGQDFLLELLSRKRWQDRDFELNLYGKGQDEQYLRDLADYFDIKDKINWCGYSHDIRRVWANNDILVLPSRVESAPLVLVEAMICGRPSVATPVGGIPEWIEDGKTGFLATCASVDAFDEALERAWQDKLKWHEMGNSAHEFAIKIVQDNPGGDVLDMLVT